MSRHKRQASRVLPPDLTLDGEEAQLPPKSTDSTQAIPTSTPYGCHGSKGSTTDRSSNPSTPLRQDSSGNHSLQAPDKKPSASTKPS
ncbi:hypothetical protein PTKIN_Ptkin11bG0086500 [Pterospermum kingtungense]